MSRGNSTSEHFTKLPRDVPYLPPGGQVVAEFGVEMDTGIMWEGHKWVHCCQFEISKATHSCLCCCPFHIVHPQDHTSQDHFCSVIDRFPVWNLEPNQTMMMIRASLPEHERVQRLAVQLAVLDIDDCMPLTYVGGKRDGKPAEWWPSRLYELGAVLHFKLNYHRSWEVY